MAMIELQRTMDAKYPPKEDGPDSLTPEGAESLCERVTRIGRDKEKPRSSGALGS